MAITQNLKIRHRSGADVARHIYGPGSKRVELELYDTHIRTIYVFSTSY